MLIMIEET